MAHEWQRLSPDEFERLCTHILMRGGFRNVKRIGGTGDRGRDIVAEKENHILGLAVRHERWIAICKRYLTNAPTPSDLDSDITWCGAHKPDGVFVFTPLRLTPATHDWLEQKQPQLGFKVIVVDGDALDHELHKDPSLEEHFFGARRPGGGQAPIFYEEIARKRRHGFAVYTAGKMASDPVRQAMAPWRIDLTAKVGESKIPVDLLHPEFVGCDHTGIAASSTVELDSYMIGIADSMIVYLDEHAMYGTVAEAMIAHAQEKPVDFFLDESIIVPVSEETNLLEAIYEPLYGSRHGCSCLLYMDNPSASGMDVDPLVRTEYWWLLTLFRDTRRNVRFHVVNRDNAVDHMVNVLRNSAQ